MLPPAERDYVLGDLEEEHRRRVERGWGRLRCAVWYWAEALRSAGPLITYSEGWGGRMMSGLEQDLRGALRVFVRAPAFAAVVVATLAVGVGGAVAVYSVLRGVVLTPLEFEESERVVMMWGRSSQYPRTPLTVGDHNVLASDVDAFENVTAEWGNTALLLGEGNAEQVSVGWIMPEYFATLRVRPRLGRALGADDLGAVVVAHDLWLRRWGADPELLGRTIDLAGESFEVVGVLGPDQNPNLPGFSTRRADHDVWRLQPPEWTEGDDRSVGWLRSTARLRDGVTLAQAQAEVDALMLRVNETVTERDGGTDLAIDLIPARADLVADVSRTLWILLGAVAGVLLIAATNVAHLMLGRGEARTGEVVLRVALGGSRIRLIRQLLVESAALALVGGLAGLAVAWWGVNGLLAVAPPSLPRLDLVEMDSGVMLFALGATGTAAVLFGVLPALRATDVDPARSLAVRSTAGRERLRASRVLVVAQVALSVALVSGTGLLLRSAAGLARTDLGFETEGVLTFTLEAPQWGATADEAAARITTYRDRIAAVPGVLEVGFTNRVPLGGGLFTGDFASDDMVAADEESAGASIRYITPGYLSALGARVLAGRDLRPEDGPNVGLLDLSAAELAWPGGDPLGRRVRVSGVVEDETWVEVVGVVSPMKHEGVAVPAARTVLLPMLPNAHRQNFRYVAVRTERDPNELVEPLREAVREVDASAVVARIRSMADLYDEDVSSTRFATLLLSLFGGVALLLATIGLHGVMAYAVRRRRREMGIRLALGAERRQILGGALGAGAALVVAGTGVGVLLSLGLGRLLGSLLYEVGPGDPATLTASALLILVVGLVGAYLPARTVLGVDPAITLREE